MSETISISTHVLDTSKGTPASGIRVTLVRLDGDSTVTVGTGETNADGRVSSLVPNGHVAERGSYRLLFDVAAYFAATQRKAFYRTVSIDFEVSKEPQHYHVPLLLSPFGYSTYRGS